MELMFRAEDMLKSAILIVLAGLVVGCNEPERRETPAQSTAEQDADFVRMASAGRMLPDLQDYLKSKEPTPRSFTFDRLNFARGSSTVRPVDEQTIYAIANALQAHENVRVRIVGYDDGERTRNQNGRLALQRAASIVFALRKAGVGPSRLEAAAGRQDNAARAAELVVLQK